MKFKKILEKFKGSGVKLTMIKHESVPGRLPVWEPIDYKIVTIDSISTWPGLEEKENKS